MSERIVGLFAVVLLALSPPTALSQMEQPQPVFTYVSQFQVPRANWPQFTEETEKVVNPVFERLMADGTIISWGNFESVVHTPDGMTHGSWWQATSVAGVMRVLDELRKSGLRPGQLSATKHEDLLMRTTVVFTSPHPATTGYLRVVAQLCQPGKGDDYLAFIRKYFNAAVEEEFKKGAATYWGFDEQYVPTYPSSMRYLVSMYPNAEGLDKWSIRQGALLSKMSPEERKVFQEGLASTTVPDSRRDLLARITHYAQK
jgi:hypothetical protein